MRKSKSHEITIRVSFNRAITVQQARYAVWNAIADYELYGDGKDDPLQPFDTGRIIVRKPAGAA